MPGVRRPSVDSMRNHRQDCNYRLQLWTDVCPGGPHDLGGTPLVDQVERLQEAGPDPTPTVEVVGGRYFAPQARLDAGRA
jgi:hypothetical protein